MSEHVIRLLPDAISNQIAAGEVVQRPASVVKELVENSVDAGARAIKVIITDAGRTAIQVIDDGCGMSEQDARLSFERHATSKIRTAEDLYHLHSFGFRGEALASICSVSTVELATRRAEDELGVKIENVASKVTSQDMVVMEVGTNFKVKNLFFNVPARRKFLKSDQIEMRHIVAEFLRVALVNPQISFTLSTDVPLYMLPAGTLRQRVSAVVGKALSNDLLPLEAETSIVKIEGFIGTPKTAKKTQSDQYFFVNGRYMSSPYFKKAVLDAYKNIISTDVQPAFFIYLTVDPAEIDVNANAQKTEIKFENESSIWQIIHAGVRESLGKYNIVPTIDFEVGEQITIPPFIKNNPTVPTWTPEVAEKRADGYNPFEYEHRESQQAPATQSILYNSSINSNINRGGNYAPREQYIPSSLNVQATSSPNRFIQLKGRYIATQVGSGLMIIDQHRASERVKYETLQKVVKTGISSSQKLVFPEVMPLGTEDGNIVSTLRDDLNRVGLEVEYQNTSGELIITAIPSVLETTEARGLIEALLYDYREGQIDVEGGMSEYILKILSSQSAVPYGRVLSGEEMATIYDTLFACREPSFSPSGKTIFTIIGFDDLDGFF